MGDTSSKETTCADLADQAVDISKDEDVQLLKVRSPEVKNDERSTYEKPTGDKDALVLSCTGTGVWSNTSTTPVLLRYTIDSDGDTYVAYQQQQ